jgi:uncharacterized protein YqhQ
MKHKKITFRAPEEDIRSIATVVVGNVTNRMTVGYGNAAKQLDVKLRFGSAVEVLESIQSLIEVLESGVKELENSAEIIELIPQPVIEEEEEEREEEEESSQTKK